MMKTHRPEIVLPTRVNKPSDDFTDYRFLIHGEKKIGKTTLANGGGQVLFLQNDPPQRAYAVMEIPITCWSESEEALRLLEKKAAKKDYPYRRVVVDGTDSWYKRCQKHVCQKLCIQHPQDEAYGKAWDEIRWTFTDAVDRLLRLPGGCWFLCHSAWKEVENRDGEKFNKLLPVLPRAAEEIINGKVDGWFAMDWIGDQRVLMVEGDERVGAGHRLDDPVLPHFRTRDGKRVREVWMGISPKEGYANLLAAFQNEQSVPRFRGPVERKTAMRMKKRH
jgi:hypothetical protein